MIQIQRLEGFYWVARTEGYARAARAFPYPITQPGVHQQVRRLEAELGVALFERVGRDRVRPTAAGRALYAYVAPFLEQLPDLVQQLRGGTFPGTLRIHAASLLLRSLLPPWLRRMQLQRPDIEISLVEMKSADYELLRSGETDLLLDYLPEVPSDIASQEIGEVHPFLVLPSNHALGRRKRITVAEMYDTPFIAYNLDRRLRTMQLELLDRFGVKPRSMHAADSAEVILGFVAAGLGYSLVPAMGDRGPRMRGVVAHPVRLPGVRFPVHAAWRKRSRANPLVSAALELAPPR